MTVQNLFADLPGDRREELIERMLQGGRFSLERIVSRGHRSPEGFWYDQEDHEWVVLLKGRACLRFADREEPVVLKPGDCLRIERRRRHRVEWTDPEGETLWLALHYRDLVE